MPVFEIEQYELHVQKYRVKMSPMRPTPSLVCIKARPTQSTIRWSLSRSPRNTECRWTRTENWRTNFLNWASQPTTSFRRFGPLKRLSEMPLYEIVQIRALYPRLSGRADSEADALERFFRGEGKQDLTSIEFAGMSNDYGLSLTERPDLASELLDRGVIKGDDTFVPSIRSIGKLEKRTKGAKHERRSSNRHPRCEASQA